MSEFIGVLADDLTGAMDAGVQLRSEGYDVKVAIAPKYSPALAENTDVFIINTDSRNVNPRRAGELVAEGMRKLLDSGCTLLYKKIDSTLRGNIGAELAAALTASGADCAMLAPALPFNHRTTVEGLHYVGGSRLQDTELARDPFSPIPTSDIGELIGLQTELTTGNLFLETVRGGVAETAAAIDSLLLKGVKIIVCDAIDDGDLSNIVKATAHMRQRVIYCGSAGLFRYIGDVALAPLSRALAAQPSRGIACGQPTLVLSGSPASMSKRQIDYAAEKLPELAAVKPDLMRLRGQEGAREHRRVLDAVSAVISAGRHAVVDASGVSKAKLMYHTRGRPDELSRESERIQCLLADIAFEAVTEHGVKNLVLFGGDTAVSVAKRLGAEGIHIVTEVEPYVPYGTLIGSGCEDIAIVTKAGGFGSDQTLVNILGALSR